MIRFEHGTATAGIAPGTAVLVAHVLPAEVRQHARALAEERLLRRLFTGAVHLPSSMVERTLQAVDATIRTRLLELLQRRPAIEGVPDKLVSRHLLREMYRLLQQRLSQTEAKQIAVVDLVQSSISKRAAKLLIATDRLVIGREMEALEVFEQAAAYGLPRLYQLPAAHYATVRTILERESEQFPDVCTAAPLDATLTPLRLERKDQELQLADRILVPSSFVRRSLEDTGVQTDRIVTIPFASEPSWQPSTTAKHSNLFLHAGRLGVRKGTHRLLRAWKRLKAYRTHRLRLIGSLQLNPSFVSEFQGCFEYMERMPRDELRRHYAEAACFVLPALAEGFAMVLLESISCGTPVIASNNSGAQGFITPGVEGLLHDAQDENQLCQALEWMLTHTKQRQEMRRAAREKAETWTWADYRQSFLEVVRAMRVRSDSLPNSGSSSGAAAVSGTPPEGRARRTRPA